MERDSIFLDTGAWIALVNSRDQWHQQAKKTYQMMPRYWERVSSIMVISETYTFLRYRMHADVAIQFLRIIEEAEEEGYLKVHYLDYGIRKLSEQILHDFQDQNLSYVDATSIAIMKLLGIRKVFGFDHHFLISGFELVPSLDGNMH
ncbi:MAG: PIN domain-containing protein [Clostridia bacterium]